MLHSQTCLLGRAVSLGQPFPNPHLQRSTSGGLNALPQPSALARCYSGPVHVPSHGSLHKQDVPLAVTRQEEVTISAQLSSATVPAAQSQQLTAQQNYQVNFGTAIRALRNDIPCTLQRSPNMDIFADNILFTDNISPRMGHSANVTQGVEAYGRQLWSVRFHAALLFSKSHVELLRLWQRDQKTVAVRWTVQCSPRLIGGVTGGKLRLDGISEYKFNDQGKICKHTVDVVNWCGLHNVLGIKPLQMANNFVPTPTPF